MFRSMIPVLLLAVAGHSLTKDDVVGFWKGTDDVDTSFKYEFYFGGDDVMENRFGGLLWGFLPGEGTEKGIWKVQSDTLWIKRTDRWSTTLGQPVISGELDQDYIALKALYRTSPKTLLVTTSCFADTCMNISYTYVGATPQFTLREINAHTSIRRPALSHYVARPSRGRLGFRVTREGHVYDLKGRSATLQNR